MLQAFVDSSRGGRRTVFQYITMLSVVALPVAAVIVLVSYTLHNTDEIHDAVIDVIKTRTADHTQLETNLL